jgi:subtilase family serine protease
VGKRPAQVLTTRRTSLGWSSASSIPILPEKRHFLEELQTKGSPNFQKFLTPAEWNSRFSPSAADEQAVVDWATSQGFTVTQRYPNRLLVDVSGTVATIEKALGVTISSYQVGSRSAYSNECGSGHPGKL